MSNKKILIVEDEAKIAQILLDYLSRDGFLVSVHSEGGEAVERVKQEQPDFIILDLMLPGKDGIAICREVREFSDVPIMMLTARVDEIDRLLGLEVGADDYVCKPFLPREVVARVHTILRRIKLPKQQDNSGNITYRDITLCSSQFSCQVCGKELELTPVEFRMLQTMLGQPGVVFSRDKLMRSCYQDERIVSDRTIDSHIKNLRRKIAESGYEGELVHSIYGVGYKLE